MSARSLLLPGVLLTTIYLMIAAGSIGAHPSGPDPGVTGGFGEPTCNQSGCHNSFKLNAGKAEGLGDLIISGLPKEYEPGRTYPIKLVVAHTQNRAAWGFQLAARITQTGAQAGVLKPIDAGTQVVDANGIQYIEHTLDGIASNTFSFTWVAPGTPAGEVTMHAAGNAADGDFGPDGDYIYTTSVAISPGSK